MPLGSIAPDFKLLDTTTGKKVSLNELKSDRATVIMFICNHCPFVKHIDNKLVQVAKTYKEKGIAFIAISANDIETYPEDSPEKMKAHAAQQAYSFPYLYDEEQTVAKAYQAACTPDFYVFNSSMVCVYRGRFDESTPGNKKPVTGKNLSDVLDQIIEGRENEINPNQEPSQGCNIKWK